MIMKVSVCDFPDELDLKDAAWAALVDYVDEIRPDIVVLPEMPFCEWIFVGDKVDQSAWRSAVTRHESMIPRLSELAGAHVMTSRPIAEGGRRFNEAFLWSPESGYLPVRRKWYLPDLPTARETLWFDRGDRNFAPIDAAGLSTGIQLCSEIMVTQHAQEIGFHGAQLLVQPRATGGARRWKIACEMSAIASGCYVASANRRATRPGSFAGGSWVLSPDAHPLCETAADAPFATAEIDPAEADRAKSQYPRDLLRRYRA
jgi:N-carbamoylputrescine amidase